MPMTYPEFRDMVRGMGADEIGRHASTEGEVVYIGRSKGILIPYMFPNREIILPFGDATILEDEEIEAHCRAINKLLGKPEESGC